MPKPLLNSVPQQALKFTPSGLATAPNQFSAVPPCSLKTGVNVNINNAGIIEGRRGTNNIYGTVTIGVDRIKGFFQYDNTLFVHYDNAIAYDSDGAGAFSAYTGTFAAPTNGYIRGVEQSQNVYVNTSTGVKVLDSLTGSFRDAGMPKALGGTAATTGTSGFLPNGDTAYYRIVWTYTDANNNLILGDVSEAIPVTNSSGSAADVDVTFYIPDTITTANTFQIYRTKQTTDATEYFKVDERAPTSAEITAQSITYTDSIEDTQLGETLYTSSAENGLADGNVQPPVAVDIATYKGYMLYANTTSKQVYELQISKISGGLASGDTITIGGITYTAGSAEDSATNTFEVFTAGTESQNIEDTARSLVKIINLDSTNTAFYAYYNSNVEDPAGKILLQERGIGGNAFAVTSSRADCWLPQLPSSGTSQQSDNSALQHAVMFSKFEIPEAVPLTNLFRVGDKNHAIKRIVALRDIVFIFKENGLYYLAGDDSATFSVKPFDLNVRILSAQSVDTMQNRVYALTDQGVVVIDEQGTTTISDPVKDDLLELQSYGYFDEFTFGATYQSDNKYLLFTLAASTDAAATQAYVYNEKTKQWTTWQCGNMSAAFVLKNGATSTLYLGSEDVDATSFTSNIYKERKSFSSLDYADESYAISITAINGTVITVADASNIAVGNTIKQASITSVVQSISGTDITMDATKYWTVGAADVYKPVANTIEFVPFHLDTPGVEKIFDEVFLCFKEALFNDIKVYFTTNLFKENDYTEVAVSPIVYTNYWGTGKWGVGVWGSGPGGGQQVIRVEIPREARRGNWLGVKIVHDQAFTSFQFEGLALQYYIEGQRIK